MKAQETRSARILVVNSRKSELDQIQVWLSAGGFSHTKLTRTAHEVLTCFVTFDPDVVLFDLQIEQVEGVVLLDRLRGLASQELPVPILALTDPLSESEKQLVASAGAYAFVARPISSTDLLIHVGNASEVRLLRKQRASDAIEFESRLAERTKDLEAGQSEIVERLALVTEYRDDRTLEHTRRVGELASETAKKLELPDDFVELMRLAAPLHDMGKTAIADALLLKPGKLTPAEFGVMKAHTTIGANILSNGRSALLKLAEEIALTHHERWEGGGYPSGLTGENIPISGRIVAVADVFDALTHQRPYKEEWSVYRAVNEIMLLSGEQFDPNVVKAFIKVLVEKNIVEAHKLAA